MSFKNIIFQREAATAEAVADAPVKSWGYSEGQEDNFDTEEEEVAPIVTEPVVVAETKPAETAPIAEATAAQQTTETALPPTWQQSLKGVDKYEALKELGYDDFTLNMLKYKDTAGDFTPYLAAKTVDYTKMSPEQLFKQDLAKQNPGMSEIYRAYNRRN